MLTLQLVLAHGRTLCGPQIIALSVPNMTGKLLRWHVSCEAPGHPRRDRATWGRSDHTQVFPETAPGPRVALMLLQGRGPCSWGGRGPRSSRTSPTFITEVPLP